MSKAEERLQRAINGYATSSAARNDLSALAREAIALLRGFLDNEHRKTCPYTVERDCICWMPKHIVNARRFLDGEGGE